MHHLLFVLLLILSTLPSSAQGATTESDPADTSAGNGVVTIYFCGTGITQKWWNGADAHSWNSSSGFWSPEHVASLFKEQSTTPQSLKYIVDGIGTGVNVPFYDMLSFSFPSLKGNPRGWRTCLNEATDHIDEALKLLPGNITLNLVGFSRGGIEAMWIAQKMEKEKRIKAINLLLFDPVPGDSNVPEKIYSLGPKVKSYLGIYASDERTWMFEPVIPEMESPATKVWMIRMPGSHETLVGNIQKDGHSIDYDPGADEFKPDLVYVSWITKVMAVEMLGSNARGSLNFAWNWHEKEASLESRKNSFLERFTAMNSYKHYDYMRTVPFIPMSIQAYWASKERGTGCLRCTLADMAEKRYNNQRCTYLAKDGKKLQIVGLEDYIKAPSADDIWNMLLEITEDSE